MNICVTIVTIIIMIVIILCHLGSIITRVCSLRVVHTHARLLPSHTASGAPLGPMLSDEQKKLIEELPDWSEADCDEIVADEPAGEGTGAAGSSADPGVVASRAVHAELKGKRWHEVPEDGWRSKRVLMCKACGHTGLQRTAFLPDSTDTTLDDQIAGVCFDCSAYADARRFKRQCKRAWEQKAAKIRGHRVRARSTAWNAVRANIAESLPKATKHDLFVLTQLGVSLGAQPPDSRDD